MKYFKYLMCLIVIGVSIIVAINFNVLAEEETLKFTGTLKTVNAAAPGSVFEVELKFENIPEGGLSQAYYNITFPSNLVEYQSSSSKVITASLQSAGTLRLTYLSNKGALEGTKIRFKVKDRDPKVTVSANINLVSGLIQKTNGSFINDSVNTGTKLDIREVSYDANLEDLWTKSGELVPEFSPTLYNYTMETTASEVTINAVTKKYNRITSGDGTGVFVRKLAYGVNTIEIHSTADLEINRIYTVKVTRLDTRDKDSSLASIAGVTNFKKDVYNYNIELPTTQGAFTVNAKASKSTSSIKYSVNDTNMTFDYGETKRVLITVTAENGTESVYTLNITRKDDRSTNAGVKSISLSGVDIKYKPDVFSYRVVVDNATKEIEIKAEAEDSRTSLEGVGKKPLATGSNVYRVIATSESGERKVYTITIVRKDKNNDVSKMSRNTNVLSLRLNGQEIKLQEGIYAYSVSVENDVTQAEFVCDVEDEKTLALLEGNRNLKIGLNMFKITITAEYGNSVMYDIIVERKELKKNIQNTKSDILNNIRNGSDAVVNVNVAYNDTNRIADNDIVSALQSNKKTLNYTVMNENRGTAYTFSINGSSITTPSEIDFNMSFTTDNQSKIDALTNAPNSVYLNFKENNTFKGKIKLKAFVGDKFNLGNTLTLYYYDKTNNTLEMVKEALKVKNNYTEFEVEKLGEYVLIDRTQVTSTSGGSGSVAIIGAVAGIIVIAIIVGIAKKNH